MQLKRKGGRGKKKKKTKKKKKEKKRAKNESRVFFSSQDKGRREREKPGKKKERKRKGKGLEVDLSCHSRTTMVQGNVRRQKGGGRRREKWGQCSSSRGGHAFALVFSAEPGREPGKKKEPAGGKGKRRGGEKGGKMNRSRANPGSMPIGVARREKGPEGGGVNRKKGKGECNRGIIEHILCIHPGVGIILEERKKTEEKRGKRKNPEETVPLSGSTSMDSTLPFAAVG